MRQVTRDLAGTLAELGIDAMVESSVGGDRTARVHLRSEVDERILVDALARSGVGDCGGIDNCVWATIHTTIGIEEEVETRVDLAIERWPLSAIVAHRIGRRLRRWARIGASS